MSTTLDREEQDLVRWLKEMHIRHPTAVKFKRLGILLQRLIDEKKSPSKGA